MGKEIPGFFETIVQEFPFPAFVVAEDGKIIVQNSSAYQCINNHVNEYYVDAQTFNPTLLAQAQKKGSHLQNTLKIIRCDWNDSLFYFIYDTCTILQDKKGLDSESMLTFLGDISHELRTPLNGIVGFAEIMLRKKLPPEKMLEYVQIIYSNSIFMMQLISDILDYAKIETGHFKLRKNYFSINRLIYDLMVVFLIDLQIRRKEHIALLFNHGLADGADMIIADEVRLRQVLVNLISNAIKFTEKGSITVGYTLKNNFLEFYVKDTGIGIEKEALDTIFDRYIQANRKINPTYGGSGIGLSIARDIITQHGGEIWIESELQVGTTFYFTIPYETKNSNV
ncbi:MAG: sensor histidine kinase [Bacteroidales bacterium]